MKAYEYDRITTAEKVKDLTETLAVPRDHFLNVRKKTSDAYIEQKERVLTRISENTGVPKGKLVKAVYEYKGRQEAERYVREALTANPGVLMSSRS